MIRRVRYKLIISTFTFVILFMIALVTTYAYFQIREDHGIIISNGEFEVEMLVYFNDKIVTLNSPFYDINSGVLTINAYDQTSENYIEDLDIYFRFTPIVSARYRFKIQQEWELGTYYINQNEENPIPPVIHSLYHEATSYPNYPFSDLLFSNEFTDMHFDQEGYVYSDDIIMRSKIPSTIHIIDGGIPQVVRSNSVLYEECYLYIDMVFDIIQANRMTELWGIDQAFFED